MSNIKYDLLRDLESKINMGESKKAHEDKNNGVSPYLHSGATIRTYMQQAGDFGMYLRERGLNKISIEESKQYAKDFIQSRESPWSQDVARSALAKIYGCNAADICSTEKRTKDIIHRGRELTPRNQAIANNHPDLVRFCQATGLRKDKELAKCSYKNIIEKDGKIFLGITGKGGLYREIELTKDAQFCKDFLEKSGDKIKIPSNFNAHFYRSDFARDKYNYALKNGYASGTYYKPHNDGRRFDRGCLDYVSKQLGHGSGRYYTVVANYLYER